MIKKIFTVFLLLAICFNIFPTNAYAKESNAYSIYQAAMQAVVSSGSWTEDLSLIADMSISQGNEKLKTKATLTSKIDIFNYSETDFSGIEMSGSGNMSVMKQKLVWNVVYKDGIAHYEYTEPNQNSVDLEIDPICFDFNTFKEDMMENTKVSGNKITFTIPGNKMKEAGIAAVNLMSGIENLTYGDVDVKVIINKETGAITTMAITFHASMTYQGYDAEVDYHIDYGFSSNVGVVIEPDESKNTETETKDGLVIYSDCPNMSIRKDSFITLSAGIIKNGDLVEDVSGITFQTDNHLILSVADTGIQDNRRYVKFKGEDVGTAQIVFSDSTTGYAAKILITVYTDNYFSYTLNSVPTPYNDKYPANIYNFNGLYIDSYKYVVNDNKTATVSFDVYNTNYTYGFVEVYKADGSIHSAALINKMHGNNTSIKEAVWDNVGCLIRDSLDHNFLSYRQESGFSKKTSIIVEIPENGYIKICNDPANSPLVNIVNSVDMLMSLGKLAYKIQKYDINAEEFAKALTAKLIKEEIYINLLKDGSDLVKDLNKDIAKKAFFSSKSLGNFSDTIAKNLSESELNLSKLIADTAIKFGWSLGEKVFKYFTGPIKKVFDGCFAFGKMANTINQHVNFINSFNAGSIFIQNQGGGTRSVQQITVESNTNFSDDTSLNIFRVTLDSNLLNLIRGINPDLYDAIVNGTSYTYNISLLENGAERQTDGEVKVYIPIPDDMKWLAYIGKAKIFRIEENGTPTEMDVKIEDGCFVFNTSHFSLYTLVGNTTLQKTTVIVIGTIFVVSILLLLFFIRTVKKRKKHKKSST